MGRSRTSYATQSVLFHAKADPQSLNFSAKYVPLEDPVVRRSVLGTQSQNDMLHTRSLKVVTETKWPPHCEKLILTPCIPKIIMVRYLSRDHVQCVGKENAKGGMLEL